MDRKQIGHIDMPVVLSKNIQFHLLTVTFIIIIIILIISCWLATAVDVHIKAFQAVDVLTRKNLGHLWNAQAYCTHTWKNFFTHLA